MTAEFTPSGVTIQTYDEIYEELAAGYRGIYGDDIDLSTNSPDGQRVGIEAKARLDMQTFAVAVYNSLDADFSAGEAQKRIIKWAGITPRPATRSQWDVTVNSPLSVTIPAGFRIRDSIDQIWQTDSDILLLAGNNTVTFFAENFGSVQGLIGDELEQVDIINAIIFTLTAPASALVGRDEETEEELRIRRNKSTENPAYSTIGQLFATLGNLPGVTELAVYENDTDAYDADKDMAAHSIWAVVEGGAVDAIIETIAKYKTQGAGRKGAVEGTYLETLTKPNGNEFIITHVMKFDRPTYVDLHVRLTATRKDATSPVDDESIKNQLTAISFDINENAIASKLYDEVYLAGDNFVATDLEISLDGSTWTDERLISEYDEIYQIAEGDITINEVIP